MTTKKLSFKIEASSTLNNVFLYLENENESIRIRTTDKKIWTNDNFQISVDDTLDLSLKILGSNNITWEVSIKDLDTNRDLWKDTGTLGEKYGNKSIREDKIAL